MSSAPDTLAKPAGQHVIYTARVHTTGGRDGGTSQSDDRRLDIRHSLPGSPNTGTNPEQLFAAGWSACFEGAMGIAARKARVKLPPDTAIDAEVELLSGEDGYSIQGRLNISLPGVPRDVAQTIVKVAEGICPYSKAIRGNVKSEFKLL
jgi:osmotically inducible protein OsmC